MSTVTLALAIAFAILAHLNQRQGEEMWEPQEMDFEIQDEFWIDMYNETRVESDDEYYRLHEAHRHWSLENNGGFDLTPVPVTF